MKLFGIGWALAAFSVAPPTGEQLSATLPTQENVMASRSSQNLLSTQSFSSAKLSQLSPANAFSDAASNWLLAADSTSSTPPSQADITLLRSAFAEFYGVNRDLSKSLDLLSQAIDRWQAQPPDERAGLYRVRGDCYMLLADAQRATQDYDVAIQLLKGPGGDAADPSELPTALLGRARALKAQGKDAIGSKGALQAASDYQTALKLTSREDWDTEQELIEDGALRNPFAAWEWGTVLRWVDDGGKSWTEAATVHSLAAQAFEEIGDFPRSAISKVDAGIDALVAAVVKGETVGDETIEVLKSAVSKTKGVEGRDVKLLQKIIAKEGEGRMALAAVLWDQGQRQEAETILGDACVRLEQLQVDAVQRATQEQSAAAKQQPQQGMTVKSNAASSGGLKFSIDDDISISGMSCSKFKNSDFLSQRLGWPEQVQKKVIKLETLR